MTNEVLMPPLGLQFRCMWVFAKVLFQGEPKPQNWVYCLNRVGETPTIVTQATSRFQRLLVSPPTPSIRNRPTPSEAFATVAVTGIRDLVSSDLTALSDKRH